MKNLIHEFRDWVDGVYGTYLDAISGFRLFHEDVQKEKAGVLTRMNEARKADPGITFGGHTYGYARLLKGGKAERQPHLHQAEIDTLIIRNDFGGPNTVFTGRMVIVSIFGYWNDHIRRKLEESLEVPKNSLKVPIMGDIRHLRDMIIHNHSRADVRVSKIRMLTWFYENDTISPSKTQIEDMVDRIFEFIRAFEIDGKAFVEAHPE